MPAVRFRSLCMILAGLAALLFGTLLVSPPGPEFLTLGPATWLRLSCGLPVVLFVPGLALVPLVLGRDAHAGSPEGKRGEELDPVWLLFGALGLTLCAHVLHFAVLRVLGLPIRWPALGAIAVVEAVAGALWAHRSRPQLLVAAPSRPLWASVLVLVLGLLLFLGWARADLLRDASWFFYAERMEDGWNGTPEPHAIEFERAQGWPWGEPVAAPGRVLEMRARNSGDAAQPVPVTFLLHGPIGLTGELRARDVVVDQGLVGTLVAVRDIPDPVERYWEWGSFLLTAVVDVPARDHVGVELHLFPPVSAGPEGATDAALVDWSGEDAEEVRERALDLGIHSMHPFQLLNVTENIRWAAEVAGPFVLPGRSPDGSSTLHQPPAWTYLYAPARELLAPQLVSASALLLVVLIGIGLATFRGVEEEGGALSALLAVPVTANVLQHGRMMVHDGSTNFPDHLYALALVLSVVLLRGGRQRLFLLWAALAATLRYPGAVVVAFAGLGLGLAEPAHRVNVRRSLERLAFGLAAFCLVMMVVGFVSGRLGEWLYALYFETIPEHFQANPEAPPFFSRPLEFGRMWMLLGGALLLFAVPFRSVLSRVAASTALLYAPFLAFIDHVSHHYFLPLVALSATSAAASLARDPRPWRRRVLQGAAAMVSVGLLLWSGERRL